MTGRLRGRIGFYVIVAAALAAAAAWTWVHFTSAKRVGYSAGEHRYAVALQFQSIDVSFVGVAMETVHQQGCFGRVLSQTTVPFRGMSYYEQITPDRWFRLKRVRASAIDPNRPLPPPVAQPDGSLISTGYKVHGWRLAIPYWPVVVTGSVIGAGRSARRVRQAIAERRSAALIRCGYCAGCGYDLRATPHRCPECGSRAAI